MPSVAYHRSPICVYLVLMMLLACVSLPFSGGTGHASSRVVGQADWPMYGYDPAHSNFNVNEHLLGPYNVRQLTLKWKFPTNGNGYDTTPAIINGTVYV